MIKLKVLSKKKETSKFHKIKLKVTTKRRKKQKTDAIHCEWWCLWTFNKCFCNVLSLLWYTYCATFHISFTYSFLSELCSNSRHSCCTLELWIFYFSPYQNGISRNGQLNNKRKHVIAKHEKNFFLNREKNRWLNNNTTNAGKSEESFEEKKNVIYSRCDFHVRKWWIVPVAKGKIVMLVTTMLSINCGAVRSSHIEKYRVWHHLIGMIVVAYKETIGGGGGSNATTTTKRCYYDFTSSTLSFMGRFWWAQTRCVLETTRNAKQWTYVDFGMRTRERQHGEHVYTYSYCAYHSLFYPSYPLNWFCLWLFRGFLKTVFAVLFPCVKWFVFFYSVSTMTIFFRIIFDLFHSCLCYVCVHVVFFLIFFST